MSLFFLVSFYVLWEMLLAGNLSTRVRFGLGHFSLFLPFYKISFVSMRWVRSSPQLLTSHAHYPPHPPLSLVKKKVTFFFLLGLSVGWVGWVGRLGLFVPFSLGVKCFWSFLFYI